MKSFLTLATFAALTGAASAVAILTPSDEIIGGQLNGANFDVGVEGTIGGVNNWPGAEPPADLINGVIGGGGEKYLNFAELNTGVIITPTVGASIVTGMELWVANDAVERDPASYELYGTNALIASAGPFAVADFTLISSGGLALPATRDQVTDATGLSQVVTFANTDAYTSYMLVFPTVVDAAGANSMQLSEVQFDGTIVPEPSAGLLALLGLAPVVLRRRRK